MIRICLVALLFFYAFRVTASEITLHFDGPEINRDLIIFYPIGNYANLYIRTAVESKGNNFNLKVDNEVKVGIAIYIVNMDLDIALYIDQNEEIIIYISEERKTVEFSGQKVENHKNLYLYHSKIYRKNLADIITCPYEFIPSEYYLCLEKHIDNQVLDMQKDTFCPFSTYHIILYYIGKIYVYGDKSKGHIEFVLKLLNKHITDQTLIPGLLLNYLYYSLISKYANESYKYFESPDWEHYDHFLTIKDPEALSFMLQVQLAFLKQMNFPFIDYCGALQEVLKYSKGFPIHDFFKDNYDCPD